MEGGWEMRTENSKFHEKKGAKNHKILAFTVYQSTLWHEGAAKYNRLQLDNFIITPTHYRGYSTDMFGRIDAPTYDPYHKDL